MRRLEAVESQSQPKLVQGLPNFVALSDALLCFGPRVQVVLVDGF